MRRNEVSFGIEGDVDNDETFDLGAAVTSGNTLVLGILPTSGEAVITSLTDNLGNTYTHDLTNANGHFYHCSNIANSPTHIIITMDLPFRSRLYAWELFVPGGAGIELDGSDSQAAGPEIASSAMTATVDDAIAMALIELSPSRTPTAIGAGVVNRLNFDGGGFPWLGPVSEHSVDLTITAAGAVTLGTTWTGQGTSTGTIVAVTYRAIPNDYLTPVIGNALSELFGEISKVAA